MLNNSLLTNAKCLVRNKQYIPYKRLTEPVVYIHVCVF